MRAAKTTARISSARSVRPRRQRPWRLAALVVLGVLVSCWWVSRQQRASAPAHDASVADAAPLDSAKASGSPRGSQIASRPKRKPAPVSLAGVVNGLDAGPLPGATVCTIDGSRRSLIECIGSDALGRFVLRVPELATALLASAPGYMTRERALPPAVRESDQPAQVTIQLERGSSGIDGHVIDAMGGAVAGATVRVHSGETGQLLSAVLSGDDGSFSARAAPGPVEVVAEADAYSKAVTRVLVPADGVLLVLAPSARIVGEVVAATTGEALPGVNVLAIPASPTLESRLSVDADDAGRFEFRDLMGGEYIVFAVSDRWASARQLIRVAVGSESSPIVLRASPATTLTGSVLLDGQPCSDANVQLEARDMLFTQSTQQDGTVRFQGLMPGQYRVDVKCPRATTQSDELEVGATPLVRRWDLEPGLEVMGQVLTPAGAAVANATVNVRAEGDPPGRADAACVTDASGKFTCSGLSAGRYACSLEERERASGEATHVVLGSGPTPTVMLATERVVEGRDIPALESALAQLKVGEIAREPIEGNLEYVIPKRLDVSVLEEPKPPRFELPAPEVADVTYFISHGGEAGEAQYGAIGRRAASELGLSGEAAEALIKRHDIAGQLASRSVEERVQLLRERTREIESLAEADAYRKYGAIVTRHFEELLLRL